MKESFLLYHSFYQPVKDLTDKEKGQLFDAIFQFQMNLPIRELSPTCQIAFKFIESQFERDSEKYERIIERNKRNGAKGGRPKENPDEPKKPNGITGNPDEPKKPDTDTDTVSDSDSEKRKRKTFAPPSLQEFSDYFISNGYSPELAERAFKGYEAANWTDSEGKPVKSWKQKCQFVWFKPENKADNKHTHLQSQKEIKGW